MSKICFKLNLIFDTDEVWHNISEFESVFAKFLEVQNLKGEKVEGGEDDYCVTALITPVPQEPQGTSVAQTPKQQVKNVQIKT